MRFNIGGKERSVVIDINIDPTFLSEKAILEYYKHGIPPEPEVVSFMMRCLQKGDVAVDAGANIGFFTVLMAELVGERGEVHAYEPDIRNYDRLVANIEKYKQVCAVKRALWDWPCLKQFAQAPDSGSSGFIADKPVAIEDLLTTTLSALSCAPRLIKCDTEGSELFVLRGARQNLAPFVITELNEPAMARYRLDTRDMRSFFRDRSYEMFTLSPSYNVFPTLIPWGIEIKPQRENTNVLFTKLNWLAPLYPELVI